MLLFLFASLSVFLSLHDFTKKGILVNQNGGQGSPGPRSDSTEFAKKQNFFLLLQKFLFFYSRLSLVFCCLFLGFKLFSVFL